ncbi:heme/hemin ABC transporter substrate-binding protein [Macrococcoides bohemicum]|uniref:heme/hemin ABC transporter substrate-binding protein n=1 Tax=Macrococcoides bohemicum TaxID=1903056 RepID=UPI00193F8F0F|nr:ABC transporter substrate-binding protein [Macrococcus bohemicus]QRN50775.1 ABC transporter substrate-binding protein [Macrococcus bohemicus]QYA44620.1 ABC transporter substrate-binding protein [Macrococcus bohemicus]
MKKTLFILLMTILFIVSGCNTTDKVQQSDSQERIISLIPSNTEILYDLGVYKEIIGVSTVDDYPKQVKDKEKFDGMKLDYEAILKAKPTIVFAHQSMEKAQEKTLQKLKSKGIKVVVVHDANSFDALYKSIEQIASVTHKEAEGKAMIKDIKRQIQETAIKYKKDVQGKKVFLEISSHPDIYTGGNHTLMNDLLKQLGAVNIFSGIEGYQAVSTEAIVKKNPDIIISTSGLSNKALIKEVKSRNGFKHVEAVKQNQIYAVDPDTVSRPGPRIAQGMETIAQAIANEK